MPLTGVRVPVEGDTVVVGGWELERSYKFRQAERNPWVALV